MSKEGWKQDLEKELSKQAQEREVMEELRERAGERKARLYRRFEQKVLERHGVQFTCPCCGAHSPGPGKYIKEVWKEHGRNDYRKTDKDDWEKAHDSWSICTECRECICPDCYHKGYCRICAEELIRSNVKELSEEQIKRAHAERNLRIEQVQKVRDLWTRLKIHDLAEFVAESMWLVVQDLKIETNSPEFFEDTGERKKSNRLIKHVVPRPLPSIEIKGPLRELYMLREGFCKPYHVDKDMVYLQFVLFPDHLWIHEVCESKWTHYQEDPPLRGGYYRNYGWEPFWCELRICRAVFPEQLKSLAEREIVENWSWALKVRDELSLAEKACYVREHRGHIHIREDR